MENYMFSSHLEVFKRASERLAGSKFESIWILKREIREINKKNIES